MWLIIALACLILALSVSLPLILRPTWAIEIQRRFYEMINWRMIPVSMPKEIRNTRIMGIMLLVIAVAAVCFLSILRP